MSQSHKYFCRAGGDGCELYVNPARVKLGYHTCLACGERIAKTRKFTVACMNKSNYMLISDPNTLKQLNPKRTT